jgi:hypothetical protein
LGDYFWKRRSSAFITVNARKMVVAEEMRGTILMVMMFHGLGGGYIERARSNCNKHESREESAYPLILTDAGVLGHSNRNAIFRARCRWLASSGFWVNFGRAAQPAVDKSVSRSIF